MEQQKENTQTTQDLATLTVLGAEDIPAMLALQDKVGSADIIAKTKESLTAHFNAGNAALGIVQDGRLVSQLTVKSENAGETATIGFFMTDPDYRGQGLAGQLLDMAINTIKDTGFSHAQARVKLDNGTQAWKHFAKQGFDVVAKGESPDQAGRQVFVLQKQLESVPVAPRHENAAAPTGLAL